MLFIGSGRLRVIGPVNQEREKVLALLASADLPFRDLPDLLEHFIIAKENDRVIGVAGLEIYGSFALLRSVAVAASSRGAGLAKELLGQIEAKALSEEIKAIYLLTETAAGYFERLGYHRISREQVPWDVQQSGEFSHICPQSAAVLMKSLSH